MLSELRIALRTLLLRPGYTVAVALTIALGVGANATIFGVVDAVLLRALPFREPARVVQLFEVTADGNGRMPLSPANFLDWQARLRSFEAVAAVTETQATLDGVDGAEPERIAVARGTGDLPRVLGVAPMLGRAYGREEAVEGRGDVIVLGHELWRRRFGGDPAVVGTTIRVNARPHTVLGVLPPDVRWPANGTDAWAPLAAGERYWQGRGNHGLTMVGRLAAGVSPEQANREVATVGSAVAAENATFHPGWSGRIEPILDATVGSARTVLLVLLGAVSFVLLIGCVNVANLALARAAARRREVAVRAALGAGTAHLLRLHLAESVVIGAIGGALGIVIAVAATRAIPAIAPVEILRLDMVRVDWRVAAFAFALAVAASFLAGAWPALAAGRSALAATMRDGGRTATGGRSRTRARDVLFVAEVALALVLLAGAGLAVRSLTTLLAVQPGFRAEPVLTAGVSLPRARYRNDTLTAAFHDALLRELRAQPGVRAAGVASALPLGGGRGFGAFWIVGRPAPASSADLPLADQVFVSDGYFDAMGIPLRRGRDFASGDAVGAPGVAVVNELLAQTVFPGQDAVGQRLQPFGTEGPEFEVVGVVGNTRQASLGGEQTMQLYLSARQVTPGDWTIVARGTGDPAQLTAALRGAVRTVDPGLALDAVRPMEDVVMASVARQRFAALLLGAFATAALLLAMVGIYGVVSNGVAERRGEFGVRTALGARPGNLLRSVIGDALRRAGVGVAIGLAAATALTRVMASQLHGVSATDPGVLGGVAVLLVLVAVVASWLPARRAARVDPAVALRTD